MTARTLDDARALDRADPLAHHRARFALPDGLIYLDGNSLGALPVATAARLDAMVRAQWGADLISSWNAHDWIGAPARVGAAIAPLLGAAPHQVIVADSVSVNLFKLLAGALALRPGRRVILSEAGNFPTDLYMAQGLRSLGLCELRTVAAPNLPAAMTADVAVVLLTHVHYQSAAVHDMAELTAAAHAAGALTLWDLSHSAGAVQLELDACRADMAVGCGYKYLNGGPGAPAFVYLADRHHDDFAQPLSGWMGHAAPFAFDDDYRPAAGMARLLCGTPSILALTALAAGVEGVADAGMPALAAKSRALSALLIERVMAGCADHGLTLASPADAGARGSHVAFRHLHAWELCQALIAAGVVGDFRAPDVLRLGIAPLYLRFEDVWTAADRLRSIMASGAWRDPAFAQRRAVT